MSNFTRLMKYLAKYWYLFAIGLTLTAVSSYLRVIPNLMTRLVLNAISPPIDADEVFGILPTAILMIIGASALSSVISFVQNYLQSYTSQKTIYNLRNDLFDELTQKSFSFYDKSRVGDIVSRVTSDVDRVDRMTSMWINQVVSIVVSFAIWVGVLLSISPLMTALCLLAIPFILPVTNRYRKLSEPIYTDQRMVYSDMNTFLQQNIVGTRVVRIFRQEDREEESFSRRNRENFDLQVGMAKIQALYPGINTLIIAAVTALIYWLGGRLIIGAAGAFKWGDLMIFIQGMSSLMMPLRFISMIANMYTEAMAAAKRIFEVIDSEEEMEDKPNAVPLPPIKGEVVFENVSFGYDPEKLVLRNISLNVKPGETVAILGPTGSGKSTLLYLIPRFYDVTSGRITIDGHDLRDVRLKSLREQIGIALQDIFLFSATIRENIAFGRPDATIEEIMEAAKAAQIHEFVESLPEGYDTIVGERGVTLSGGQKQRLTIARTLLKDPRILIFDDTTSFVDTETEHKIQKALEVLLEGRTAFIVTQRLSAIKGADKIIVLRNGGIVESGTHEELLAKDGIYATIYRTQFAPREEILAKRIGGGE